MNGTTWTRSVLSSSQRNVLAPGPTAAPAFFERHTPEHPAPVFLPPPDAQKKLDMSSFPNLDREAPAQHPLFAQIRGDIDGSQVIATDPPEDDGLAPNVPERTRGRRRRTTSWAYWLPVDAPAIPAEVDPQTVPCRAPGCTDGCWHRVQRLCRPCYRSAYLSLGRAPGSDHREPIAAPERPVSYAAEHYRVRAALGDPGAWPCARCGAAEAVDWAMLPDAESVRQTTDGKRAADPHDYAPMCRQCHGRMDPAQPPEGAEVLAGIDWQDYSTHVDAQGRPLRDWRTR